MKEAKFLVFFSAPMELFKACAKCLCPCTVDTKEVGTFLSIKQLCPLCGHLRIWNSQPLIGKHATPAGNLLLSASILFAGASPTQVLRVLEFLSVPTISQRTFFRHQSHFLLPAVSRVWEKSSQHLLLRLRRNVCHYASVVTGGQIVLGTAQSMVRTASLTETMRKSYRYSACTGMYTYTHT